MRKANRFGRRWLVGAFGVSVAFAGLGACGGTTPTTAQSKENTTNLREPPGPSTSTSPAPSTSTSTTTTTQPTTTASTVLTTTTAAPVNADAFQSRAGQVVADLAAGRFAAVTAQFDPLMTSQLPTTALQAAWTSYQQMLGPYRSQATPVSTAAGGLDVENVPVTMANGQGKVRVTFHPDGTIAGLYLLNAGA